MHAGPDLFGGDPFLGSMLGPGDFTGAGGLGGGLGGFGGGTGAGLGGELPCFVICIATALVPMHYPFSDISAINLTSHCAPG